MGFACYPKDAPSPANNSWNWKIILSFLNYNLFYHPLNVWVLHTIWKIAFISLLYSWKISANMKATVLKDMLSERLLHQNKESTKTTIFHLFFILCFNVCLNFSYFNVTCSWTWRSLGCTSCFYKIHYDNLLTLLIQLVCG